MTTGFTNLPTETSLQVLNPRIEYLIAVTVLGYILAEWRGRSELSLAQDFPRLFLSSLGVTFLLEIASGFQVGAGASLARAGMVVIGALFGGTIYPSFASTHPLPLGTIITPASPRGLPAGRKVRQCRSRRYQ